MANARYYLDKGSLITIFVTLILFVAALYFTGFTHDLLLEAGVFLVSVKLILMSYKDQLEVDSLNKKLVEIHSLIKEIHSRSKVN